MKKGGLKEKFPFVFGRGIIIMAILIPASLSFLLGYFVGKSTTKESSERRQFQSQNKLTQPVESQSKQAQSQTSEPTADTGHQTAESQDESTKESQQTQEQTTTMYTVQVGAFKNAADAEAVKTKLEKNGYKTSMAISESKKEGSLYKVWVGRFTTRNEADALSVKIRRTEGFQAFVTVKKEESPR